MLQFDEETSSRLRTMYEAPYAVERRRRIRTALAATPGESILDVGCGPGYVTCEVAAEVDLSGSVTGVDSSQTMLALASARAAELGLQNRTRFIEGDAVHLPVGQNSFDGAVISQVYEYVADLPQALYSLHQVLKPGGRAIIFDTDWDSVVWHSTDPDRMERVLKAWEEHLADPVLPRTLGTQLRAAAFAIETVDAVSMFDYAAEDSGLRALAGLVGDYVPGRGGISASEAEAWIQDLDQLAARGEYFLCITGFLFTARRL